MYHAKCVEGSKTRNIRSIVGVAFRGIMPNWADSSSAQLNAHACMSILLHRWYLPVEMRLASQSPHFLYTAESNDWMLDSHYIYTERKGRVYSLASYKISYYIAISIYDNFIY